MSQISAPRQPRGAQIVPTAKKVNLDLDLALISIVQRLSQVRVYYQKQT
jgi:hypothetical protein